ncbi:MAG: hypothetical protein WCX97_05475 [Candidatus Magasanikbacteria bacterium]
MSRKLFLSLSGLLLKMASGEIKERDLKWGGLFFFGGHNKVYFEDPPPELGRYYHSLEYLYSIDPGGIDASFRSLFEEVQRADGRVCFWEKVGLRPRSLYSSLAVLLEANIEWLEDSKKHASFYYQDEVLALANNLYGVASGIEKLEAIRKRPEVLYPHNVVGQLTEFISANRIMVDFNPKEYRCNYFSYPLIKEMLEIPFGF